MADRSSDVMGGLHQVMLYVLVCCQIVMLVSSARVCTSQSSPHSQGVCGRRIPELLHSLCGKTGYQEKEYTKRSEVPLGLRNIGDMDANTFYHWMKENAQISTNDLAPSLRDILFNKREASTFLDKRTDFYRTGVSCECCYNRCSIKEMANYCKDPAKAIAALGGMAALSFK